MVRDTTGSSDGRWRNGRQGHKYERDAPKRQASIEEKMAEMPVRIQEYRAEQKKKRFKTDLQKLLTLPKSKSSKR